MATSVSFRTPGLASLFPGLLMAESTRHGGVSPAPFHSLNLGLNTADDPAHVAANHVLFFQRLGVEPGRVASSHQVHGSAILTVRTPGRVEGYDALITNEPDLFLTVTVADCTPVLLVDPVRRAVAAIHAGWRGTAARITAHTLEAMQTTFGTRPGDCYAYIGTCIDACSFEVGPEVADAFAPAHRRFDADQGRHFVDLKAANRHQLTQAGLPAAQIETSPYSTVLHHADYFSYRREGGHTGRMLAVVGFRARSAP